MARLLIVEDEELLLSAMEIILTDAGHQVRAVNSAFAALDAIEAEQPDLIVSDIMMPRMSGLQLLAVTRIQYDEYNLPFLFVTANTTPDLKREFDRLDKVAFLYKPFNTSELSKAVDDALQTL